MKNNKVLSSIITLSLLFTGCGSAIAESDTMPEATSNPETAITTGSETIPSQVEITSDMQDTEETKESIASVLSDSNTYDYDFPFYIPEQYHFGLQEADQEQIFEFTAVPYGEVTFASKAVSKEQLEIALFRDQTPVCTFGFGPFHDNPVNKPKLISVSFEDMDLDGKEDITVIIESYSEGLLDVFTSYYTFVLTVNDDQTGYEPQVKLCNLFNDNHPTNIKEVRALRDQYYGRLFPAKDLLSSEEIKAMDYDARMQAYLDGRIKAPFSASFLEYRDDSTFPLEYEGTISDLQSIYYNENVWGNYATLPTVTTRTLHSKGTDFLHINLSHSESANMVDVDVLIRNGEEGMEVVYVGDSAARYEETLSDGIVIESAGSSGAASHSAYGLYINELGQIIPIYHFYSESLQGFHWLMEYKFGLDCDLTEKLESVGLEETFINDILMDYMEVNGSYYFQMYPYDYEQDPDFYQASFDKLAEAFSQSNVASKGTLIGFDDDLSQYARSYANQLGVSIR